MQVAHKEKKLLTKIADSCHHNLHDQQLADLQSLISKIEKETAMEEEEARDLIQDLMREDCFSE